MLKLFEYMVIYSNNIESIQNEKNIVTQDSNSNRCRFMNKWYKVLFISLVLELVLFLFVKITIYIFKKIKKIKEE